MQYIFVYGSLMGSVQSQVARTLHAKANFLGEGYVQGWLYDLGQYPGLVTGDRGQLVKGHVFELLEPASLLSFLDTYEGIIPEQPETSEYRREMIQVEMPGETLNCWVYLYNQPTEGLPLIESGDYLTYLEQNPLHLAFLKSLRANQ